MSYKIAVNNLYGSAEIIAAQKYSDNYNFDFLIILDGEACIIYTEMKLLTIYSLYKINVLN